MNLSQNSRKCARQFMLLQNRHTVLPVHKIRRSVFDEQILTIANIQRSISVRDAF